MKRSSIRKMRLKILVVLLLSIGACQSRGTTIVVKVEKERIILGADTRRSTLTTDPNPFLVPTYFDDNCKIVTVGKVGVGITGNSDYHAVAPGDPVADWDARTDARTVLFEHGRTLSALADAWQKKAVAHFISFYREAPSRVSSYANGEHALLEGLFAGWDERHKPELIIVKIVIDPTAPGGISGNASVLGVREQPYTSNGITRQLIEEPFDQSKAAAEEWQTESLSIPQAQRDWRYIEFIIKVTADYDPTVGKTSNILELRPYRRYKWIQNNCCPK